MRYNIRLYNPLKKAVTDVKVTLLDGSDHEVDSSLMAFKTAAIEAMKIGMAKASPVLLEPICKVEIERIFANLRYRSSWRLNQSGGEIVYRFPFSFIQICFYIIL